MSLDTRKKILFLITKSNWGGAQRYVYDLATNLNSKHYSIIVALGGDGPLREKLLAANISVKTIPSLQRNISLRKEVGSFIEIAQLIRREKPDVFHINSSKAGGTGAFLGRLFGVPRIIFTAHGWYFNEERPKWQTLVAKFFHWLTVLFAHQTIAVSQAIKQQLDWPFVQKKITVVHNGRTRPEFMPPEASRLEIVKQFSNVAPYLADTWTATIGELHPVKCHAVMIEAVAQVVANGHHLRHFIIGEGEERPRLESLIATHQLTEHVFLLGHIDEAARLLRGFDIYVQPSRSEALAYTVIEATQAGLPIIASRVGGIPEIITDESIGRLVDPGDPLQIVTSIEELFQHPDTLTRLEHNAKQRSQAFSMATMIEKTEAIYNDNK